MDHTQEKKQLMKTDMELIQNLDILGKDSKTVINMFKDIKENMVIMSE